MMVILLSAGRGTRMLPLTRNTPKCLLEIKGGITVIENQLDLINQNRLISKVVLVLGYLIEQVEARLETKKYNFELKMIYNPFYDISNNLMSLWTVLSDMNQDFIIINGDNIFNKTLLDTILSEKNDGIHIAVDKKEYYDHDDMKILMQKDKILKISKEIDPNAADGEAAGFHMVRGEYYLTLFRQNMEVYVRKPESRNEFYLNLFNELINNEVHIKSLEINQNDWAEIDFHADLELVRKSFIRNAGNILNEK